MKRWIVVCAGLMLAFAVQASDSVRFGSRVITVGDSESKVIEVAGEPERRVELQNKFGAAIGYRLDYEQGRKTVQIYISQGQVTAINEVY